MSPIQHPAPIIALQYICLSYSHRHKPTVVVSVTFDLFQSRKNRQSKANMLYFVILNISLASFTNLCLLESGFSIFILIIIISINHLINMILS